MSIYKGCSGVFLTVSFVLLAALAGCGGTGDDAENGGSGNGGGGSGPPGPPPETTVPTVTAMTPGEDSSGTGTNSKLTATLSEAMIPAMITAMDPANLSNPENFRLHNGVSYLPGTVSYDATNHIAVFTPAAAFAPSTRYTATIITGIKDLAGNPLTTDFAWCFTTAANPDGTPPSVTSTIPANAASDVAVNRKITATFSEDMNSSTLTSASFTVTGPGPVSGTVTYVGRTAVFTPSNSLASNTTYTARITTGAMDLAGNASQANAWTFTTGANADVIAPFRFSTNPANSASGVAIDEPIRVTLSEPMDPATLNTANFAVTGPGATLVIGTVAFDATNNTATFTRINHPTTPAVIHPPSEPVSNLERGTTYTATLTTGAKDLAGNALAGNVVWSFSTAP